MAARNGLSQLSPIAASDQPPSFSPTAPASKPKPTVYQGGIKKAKSTLKGVVVKKKRTSVSTNASTPSAPAPLGDERPTKLRKTSDA